jgi:hypothetical protein
LQFTNPTCLVFVLQEDVEQVIVPDIDEKQPLRDGHKNDKEKLNNDIPLIGCFGSVD